MESRMEGAMEGRQLRVCMHRDLQQLRHVRDAVDGRLRTRLHDAHSCKGDDARCRWGTSTDTQQRRTSDDVHQENSNQTRGVLVGFTCISGFAKTKRPTPSGDSSTEYVGGDGGKNAKRETTFDIEQLELHMRHKIAVDMAHPMAQLVALSGGLCTLRAYKESVSRRPAYYSRTLKACEGACGYVLIANARACTVGGSGGYVGG
eukprot:1882283-Pleurochrysis_carterae.AAC.2